MTTDQREFPLERVREALERIRDFPYVGVQASHAIVSIARDGLDALAALPQAQADGWQDIASAPKLDGKHLLLFGDGPGWMQCTHVGHWRDETGWRDWSGNPAFPTHWRPLPAPPVIAEHQTENL